MSSGAEDDSPRSGRADDHDLSIMTDSKAERASSVEQSPTNNVATTEGGSQGAKSNAKDPSRPRRKKARRACFACQRAHLTCGDERPCLRCIKRGLQDQCHDGVRKKAKYLHDAPAEALMPGFAGAYHGTAPQPLQSPPNSMQGPQPGILFAPDVRTPYTPAGPMTQPAHMNQGFLDDSRSAPLGNEFTGQSEHDNSRYQTMPGPQASPGQDLQNVMNPAVGASASGSGAFDATAFFDPNDPALFNFNISDLNFGNHYGALEFGMLGHISGAVGTPDVDPANTFQPAGIPMDGSSKYNNYGGQNFSTWQNAANSSSRQNSSGTVWNNPNGGMDAFAIGEQNSLQGQSPHSQQGQGASPELSFAPSEQPSSQHELLRQSISHAHQRQQLHNQQSNLPLGPPFDAARKRRRNTSEIYASVTAPYSYTQGFHALIACLTKRFPQRKVMRIAKALADIRPSFISCNQNLNHDDLIFMEKCFQRTLYEYESFVNRYGTPTIICRRTGEIAAVSKEFSLVTGWQREVLLGREPNLNVNFGSSGGSGGAASGSQTGASTRGQATPRNPQVDVTPGRPQPVFLAELLDEDSVVQFYEDFAELAFGASRTAIIGAPCALLKYRTKDDLGWDGNDTNDHSTRGSSAQKDSSGLMRSEAGMNGLGAKNGRVDCSMCWTVKRDTFGMPMLVVMNFLPII